MAVLSEPRPQAPGQTSLSLLAVSTPHTVVLCLLLPTCEIRRIPPPCHLTHKAKATSQADMKHTIPLHPCRQGVALPQLAPAPAAQRTRRCHAVRCHSAGQQAAQKATTGTSSRQRHDNSKVDVHLLLPFVSRRAAHPAPRGRETHIVPLYRCRRQQPTANKPPRQHPQVQAPCTSSSTAASSRQ